MKSQIFIFESGISEGIASMNPKFYPPETPESERWEQFKKVKDNIGKRFNFEGNKIFQTYQKNEINNIEYEDGTYHMICDEDLNVDDYWKTTIEADILLISNKYKNVVVGHQMADCPILIIEDRNKGVTALSHCGALYIDRELPRQTVEALQKSSNSNIEDLYAYVGTCVKKDRYIYDKYPSWAKHKNVWENSIVKEDDGYHIDMNRAIREQLEKKGIKHIEESNIDTTIDPRYYSHIEAVKGNKEKFGQNFVGFYYK